MRDKKPRAPSNAFNPLNGIPLGSCGVAHVYQPAAEAAARIMRLFCEHGFAAFEKEEIARTRFFFCDAGAKLLKTTANNISYVENVASAFNLIALGLSFEPGDEILVYNREYPSSILPWSRPGTKWIAKTTQISGAEFESRALRVSVEDFSRAITAQTKVVVVSHVQFTSGAAVDLQALGALCKAHNILFIVDAAQSFGCMPIFPEQLGIDALACSGWKWLFGPLGSGILYTSERLRARLIPTFFGPDMREEEAYEDLHCTAHKDGQFFHASTLPLALMRALSVCIEDHALRWGIERIWNETKRLQDLFLSHLHMRGMRRAPLSEAERGSILSFVSDKDPITIWRELQREGVVLPFPRGNYLRVAIPYFLEDTQVITAAEKINYLL